MNNQQRLDAYRQGNLSAARIILQDPERYGGPKSLMVMWAEAVFERDGNPLEAEAQPNER